MSEPSLKKMAAKLAVVAAKKQLDNKDMEILREAKDTITAVLQGLKECDCCGAAVAEIARLELDGVRAAVCQACGIKALKNKSLVIKNVKKKEAARHEAPKSHSAPAHHSPASAKAHPAGHAKAHEKAQEARPLEKKKPFKTDPHPFGKTAAPEPDQPSLFSGGDAQNDKAEKDGAFEEIARACNSKILIVKKIHQLASAIAFPMNLDRTVSYVRMEAQGQGISLSNEELRKMIGLLIEKAGLKVKE